MRMTDLIIKKREQKPLTEEEINWIIEGYTKGDIPDYQMSSLLMAICFQDMNDEERYFLTKAVVDSGEVLDLSNVNGKTVDKHSTGGVGDKTSLALGPLIASCNVKLAKMSGRGLGHTGGTLDKLESIAGFNIELSEEDFINQVNEIGISIIGQTKEMCPADKKLYALRDVTGTIESIPLIASSIMGKKIAAGAETIVLDVKVGSGAFMKDIEHARTLSKAMVQIGKKFERNVSALITNMDEPLGEAVGNSLEVIEAIETLKGNGPKDFEELVLNLGAHILVNAGEAESINEAMGILKTQIDNHHALNKFKQFIKAQGGDELVVDDYSRLPQAKYIYEVKAENKGYVKAINALAVGNFAMKLGAGRETKVSEIDLAVGLKIKKKIGDLVDNDSIIGVIYSNSELNDDSFNEFRNLFTFTDDKIEKRKLILDVIK
ncbi:pyrimidine-nucleoside phosphorylase [Mycoplasmatota bacterium]|nr:pyrimidine-nucleoside phosphorylase [Mycoplasmatota bacterium]